MGYCECHCGAYPEAPHEWRSSVSSPQLGGCPALPVPDPHVATRNQLCRCVFRGGSSGSAHVWNPGGTHVGSAACPEDGPVRYIPASELPPTQPGYVADVYSGGGKREENGDRPRFDLLWTENQPLERQMLHRDAVWYQKGAAKYGERNWERFDGAAELARAQASLGRHYAAFMLGLTDEDHAAAVRANVQFIEYIREQIATTEEPEEKPQRVSCGNPNPDCGALGGFARCGGCRE